LTIVTRETWTITWLQDALQEPLIVVQEQVEIFPEARAAVAPKEQAE